jgi:hypothetical protein
MSPVLELLLDSAAHFEAEVGRNRHIARIEKAMNVAPKQNPVSCLMCAAGTVGSDVSGIEGWKFAPG